ncbi:hypothetical protein RI367_005842 [Sorochytrium milnesiophthora]
MPLHSSPVLPALASERTLLKRQINMANLQGATNAPASDSILKVTTPDNGSSGGGSANNAGGGSGDVNAGSAGAPTPASKPPAAVTPAPAPSAPTAAPSPSAIPTKPDNNNNNNSTAKPAPSAAPTSAPSSTPSSPSSSDSQQSPADQSSSSTSNGQAPPPTINQSTPTSSSANSRSANSSSDNSSGINPTTLWISIGTVVAALVLTIGIFIVVRRRKQSRTAYPAERLPWLNNNNNAPTMATTAGGYGNAQRTLGGVGGTMDKPPMGDKSSIYNSIRNEPVYVPAELVYTGAPQQRQQYSSSPALSAHQPMYSVPPMVTSPQTAYSGYNTAATAPVTNYQMPAAFPMAAAPTAHPAAAPASMQRDTLYLPEGADEYMAQPQQQQQQQQQQVSAHPPRRF